MNRSQLQRSVWCQPCRLVAFALLGGAYACQAARAADGPSIIRPRVFVGVYQSWHAWQPATNKFQDNMTSWEPKMKFRVAGPVPGGSQFVVEFTKPGDKPWLSLDCQTQEIKAGETATVETPTSSSAEAEKKYTTGTGIFGFKIHLKNELTSQNQVLYSGHFKVGKVSKYNGTPITKNQWDYFVDYDWALPFAYLWFAEDQVSSQLACSMWFKGAANGIDLAGYVFYKGKQIGSTKDQGSDGTTEEELNTAHMDKGDPSWQLRQFQWYNISPTPFHGEVNDKLFYLDKNPGDYEIKVLRGGKLARDMKFKVGDNGKIVDNGWGAADKLNTARMVFPVQVLGTQDPNYDKTAWKNAFFGNLPQGLEAVP